MSAQVIGSFGATESEIPVARPQTGWEQTGGLVSSPVMKFQLKEPVRAILNAPATKFPQKDADRKLNINRRQPNARDHSKSNKSAVLLYAKLHEALFDLFDKHPRSHQFIDHTLGRLFWGENVKLTLSAASIAVGDPQPDGKITNRETVDIRHLDGKNGCDILYIVVEVVEYASVAGHNPGMNFKVLEMIVDRKRPQEPLPLRVSIAPDAMEVEGAVAL